MLLRMYWDWTGSTTITPAGTDTERYDTFDSHLNLVFELATSTQAGTGASGTTTATFGGATSGGLGATIAIASAPAGWTIQQITHCSASLLCSDSLPNCSIATALGEADPTIAASIVKQARKTTQAPAVATTATISRQAA